MRRAASLSACAATLLAVCLACMSPGRAAGPPLDAPSFDDGGFAVGTPTPEALARYERAAAYSRAHHGLALLVIEGDAVVFEDAENGYDGRRGHHVWSGAKAFGCALAMAAVADGKVALEEPVADTLTEWKSDPQKSQITVRQLLDFTSGLSDASPVLTTDALRPVQRVPDKAAWALANLRVVSDPGTTFRYLSSHPVMLAAFLVRRLGEDPLGYLQRRVLDPIGFQATGWMRDPAGLPFFSFGAFVTPRSWARFGVLLRDRGMFRARRILPEALVDQCFVGSAAMPAFGLGLWLNVPISAAQRARLPGVLVPNFAPDGPLIMPRGPPDLRVSAGYRDNRLYLIPSQNLVIVRLGTGDARFVDSELLGRLLPPLTR